MNFCRRLANQWMFASSKVGAFAAVGDRRCVANSTIFNLASGHGRCGVAVIRVSGPETKTVLTQMAATASPQQTLDVKPRYATLRKIRHPRTRQLIDEGLVLWFPAPHSFTGEDCCEFHVHGGLAVVSAMNEAINSVHGVRPSLPGEFTKRAFWAGKLDLSQVEGLADLIHAETEVQRKQALLQAQGVISRLYNGWRQRLLRIIAHLEAYIDFAEDQDIEPDVLDQIGMQTRQIIEDIENFARDNRKGEMIRYGAKTVILGEPNVGKSSFMNHICRKRISIVANVPGTTRDIIESSFNIAGYPILLADTAGLRCHTDDPIEAEGISRAVDYAENADLIILIMDATKLAASRFDIAEYQREYMLSLGLQGHDDIGRKPHLLIVNKIDLLADARQAADSVQRLTDGQSVAYISCKDEVGLSDAMAALTDILKQLCGDPSEGDLTLSHERHRHLLQKCLEHLVAFESDFLAIDHAADACVDYALLAQKLRDGLQCIGHITGIVRTDEILDVIFRDFCIGK